MRYDAITHRDLRTKQGKAARLTWRVMSHGGAGQTMAWNIFHGEALSTV